jgi:glycosyltransferase involved in cell wall biosynthesis
LKNVIIRAPLLSVSGYGVHSRQILKWLMSKEDFNVICQVVQWGNTFWMLDHDAEDGLVGEVMKRSINIAQKPDMSFQVQLPDEWDADLAKFNVGVSAVVETDICHPRWIEGVNKMDLVIVPSEHAKKVLESSGNITTPVEVVGEWYHTVIDTDIENCNIDYNFDTDFNFLCIAQFTGNNAESDRKNLYYTIKWFCEEFAGDKDVGLVLKTNHGRSTKIDRQLTKNKIRQVVSEVRKGEYPRVHLIHGNLSQSEISGLYRHDQIKCLISLTRGEGFGLPLLEAAACDLPVIATNWSAHIEFLKLGRFIPINYNLQNIHSSKIDDRIFIEGQKWAEPSESDFKKKVKKFKERSQIPKQWAEDLGKKIRSSFCSSEIMKRYDEVINEHVRSL